MSPVLIALASVKASPGVTTTALALAALWPAPQRLVIETDPSGGDLGAWLGLAPAPGLATLAAAIRRDASPGITWRHAQAVGGGVSTVVAPAGAGQAAACLATLAAPQAGTAWLDPGAEAVLIADCGRLDPRSAAFAVAARAALTLLLVRPRVSELAHLAGRLPGLTRAGLRPALLLAPVAAGGGTGEACYPPGEIAAALGVRVEASLPADPHAIASVIRGRGVLAPSRRLPLAQAVSGLAAALAARLTPPAPSAVPDAPAHRVPPQPMEVTST